MRPIDAAVAGTDSLVILDEAHLAPHLRALLPALAECTPGAQAMLGEARSRPSVVALTATGDAGGASRFDLDADDEAREVVRQRLDAVKPTQVRILDTGDVGHRLAEAALPPDPRGTRSGGMRGVRPTRPRVRGRHSAVCGRWPRTDRLRSCC